MALDLSAADHDQCHYRGRCEPSAESPVAEVVQPAEPSWVDDGDHDCRDAGTDCGREEDVAELSMHAHPMPPDDAVELERANEHHEPAQHDVNWQEDSRDNTIAREETRHESTVDYCPGTFLTLSIVEALALLDLS